MGFSHGVTTLGKYVTWSWAGLIILWLLLQGFPGELSTLVVIATTSAIAIAGFRYFSEDKEFITTLFLAALVVRITFGIVLHLFPSLREFFGGDSVTYDILGGIITDYWNGLVDKRENGYMLATMTNRPGWGMNYIVAAIYFVFGKSFFAAQSFCGVIGAATAPMVYFCANKIFNNRNVSKTAAFAVAFFPAFVIWSAQLLKDGLIIFLLVVVITMVLYLQEKLSYAALAVLVFALFGIITLRFYIFYMVAVAIAGSFVVGLSNKSVSIFRRAAILTVIGLGLTYLGVIRNASVDIERFASLERIQISRLDLARSASGFAEEADVSTAEGAITTIPIGLAYLMLAPFPWQISSVRQAITLPEVLLWWAMFPLMIAGIVYAIKHRLRSTFPILFFSLILTLAYSIFQGNVGTAYRQRTQIQVFLFIFIAVGWELWKEKRENRKMENMTKQRRFVDRLETGSQQV